MSWLTATQTLSALRKGEIGSRELLDRLIARIERHNPAINAVVVQDYERARARAEAADAARRKGQSWCKLHGLPMTVKECWAGLIGNVRLPSTVVPVGRTRAGLPIGMQVVGPYLEDHTALDVVRHVERLVGGFVPPPAFA